MVNSSKDKLIYIKDNNRTKDDLSMPTYGGRVINSRLDFFNDVTGERIFEPLHNKTVIAGSAFTAFKLFNLDRAVLDNTPTYDTVLGLNEGATGSTYPTMSIKDAGGNVIGSVEDESQRTICAFCLGMGGCGSDIADVFTVPYASWINPDNLVPFRYPLQSADDVDESVYKGKKSLTLADGREVNAYYFKTFTNTPTLVQNYASTIGTFSDSISSATVYNSATSADQATSYVELHLKITREDVREFYIAHSGIEQARINQISLLTGWQKDVQVTKLDSLGNMRSATYSYLQDVRSFSVCNFPNEVMSDSQKSISIIYTLFF